MSRIIESVGQDIEGAIAQGLAELNVTRAQVMVEILEQPMRRMLNLGTRLARVRLTVIDDTDTEPVPAAPSPSADPVVPLPNVPTRDAALSEPPMIIQPLITTQLPAIATPVEPVSPVLNMPPSAPKRATARAKQATGHSPRRIMDEDDRAVSEELGDVSPDPINAAQTEQEAAIGVAVVEQLLGYMGIPAQVSVRKIEPQRGEPRYWLIEVRGSNLGLLVGTRGETVAALQYVTRLMVSRQVGHHANLVIDVDGYKARREDMLKRLAQRMAAQAIQMKHSVSLEPMPPHERRIIHLTLRNHPEVTTESVGQGDKRKVTIVPRHR